MRIFCELGTQQFTAIRGVNQLLENLRQKRSPLGSIEVQFTRDGQVVELATGSSGVFEVKIKGEYDTEPLTEALAWVKTGTGEDTVYTFTLVLINDALDARLGINAPVAFTTTFGSDLINKVAHGLTAGMRLQVESDDTLPAGLPANTDLFVLTAGMTADAFKVGLTNGGTPINITDDGTGNHFYTRVDNDLAEVELMAAMRWIENGNSNETQTIPFFLVNDICREGDVPPSTPPLIYGIFLDGITTMAEFKAVPTLGLTLGYLVEVLIVVSGQLSWLTYRLEAGPTTDVEPGQVEPDDYDLGTNNVHWRGAVGPSGPSGRSAGFRYEWNTNTAATDPGSGKIKLNAAVGSETFFRISETDQDGNPLGGFLANLDTSTSAVRGRIYIQDPAIPTNFLVMDVTGNFSDDGAWNTFPVSHVDGGGSFTNGQDLTFLFIPKGDKGDTGRDSGLKYQFNSAVSADPATGKFRFDNATFMSATQLGISETDGDGNNLATLLATLNDGNGTNRSVVIAQKANGTGYFAFYVTGTTFTDNGGWDTISITPISTSGSIANNDVLYLRFATVGDTGADGTQGGFQYLFNNTAGGTPTFGEFTFSNVTTFTSITSIKIHAFENQNSTDISGILATLDDGTSARRCLIIGKNASSSVIFSFYVTGDTTVAGSVRTFAVTAISGGVIPANGEEITLIFIPIGDRGNDSGLSYLWNTTTAGTGPGSGKININNASLASATLLYLSHLDNDGNTMTTFLHAWDDATSTIRGRIRIFSPTSPTNFAIYNITGNLTDLSPYDSIVITHVVSGGAFTNNMPVIVQFVPTGDKGDTGTAGSAGPGYLATSASSLLIAVASKTFATQAGLAYTAGARVRAASAANTANYMEGIVTSYSSTTLIVAVDTIGGSGTFADWNINLAGNVGATSYDAAVAIPAGTSGVSIDMTAASMTTARVLTANSTFTITNLVNGKVLIVHIKQAASGGPFTTGFTNTVVWLGTGGAAPTQSAGVSVIDAYTFWYDGTNLYGSWAPGA